MHMVDQCTALFTGRCWQRNCRCWHPASEAYVNIFFSPCNELTTGKCKIMQKSGEQSFLQTGQ